ncbi:MAG: cytochrome c oxidase subunit II [Candidatus Kapabacteria bacterium]|nr:cytochrome c oxidase subunit II [Candidatus Kapabacteria bacterium]MCS7169588.1 cytochrome c oxidase subunit II [Candidatus Kapabacteria bacterium]MDW7996521.1 cytochrome c oxidase subunit II [Bacteroidota bacterium]MDW8224474.1 cytochrome c oxidase subunit II [Bacteroidota bacterium]
MRTGSMHAVLFAVAVVGLVIVGVVTVGDQWWWLPPLASVHGAHIDWLFDITMVITGIVFVVVHLLLAYFVWRYRMRSPEQQAYFYLENRPLEVTYTIIPAIVLTGLVAEGTRAWFQIHGTPPENAMPVRVIGEQFAWRFQYPGSDGELGRFHPRYVSEVNPFGIDPGDPAAKDDIVTTELHVPVNKPVVAYINAKDVLHSFFVPELRVKQDAVPGMTTRFWFVPTRIGTYDIPCTELCGQGHYIMRGQMVVESDTVFEAWLAEQPTLATILGLSQ